MEVDKVQGTYICILVVRKYPIARKLKLCLCRLLTPNPVVRPAQSADFELVVHQVAEAYFLTRHGRLRSLLMQGYD